MGLAISIIAILAALGALWVAAEASKRAEGQQKKFVDAHLINIKQSITDLRTEVNTAMRRIDQMEERLKGASEGSAGDIEKLNGEMAALKANLGVLTERLAAKAAPPPAG